MTILQSYRQGVRVWGEHGMDTLWSAATVKLVGSGLDDARLAEDLSRLIGDHDVPVRSTSRGHRNTNETVSLRRQRILGPEDVRSLPRGTALLLATGCRAGLLRLRPWYERHDSRDIADRIRSAEDGITRRAGGAGHGRTADARPEASRDVRGPAPEEQVVVPGGGRT